MRSAAPPPRLITWRATAAPCGARDVAGAIAGPVVHDQHRGLDPAHGGGDSRQHRADVVLLVVGGDHDRHLVAEPVRQAGEAELLPRDSLEHRGQLAVDPAGERHVAQQQDEQHEDREHGQAEDPAAAALAERERLEQRVRDLGCRDDREREAGEQQDQDVDVAQRPPPPDGECDHRDADDKARDTKGGELHGARAEDTERIRRIERVSRVFRGAMGRAAMVAALGLLITASLGLRRTAVVGTPERLGPGTSGRCSPRGL